ncbi:MAG: FAD-dependent pyridine nucleotide-disulfide oxidoreductase [Flaviaesturariibacter sp.]|nr:FAD-dependent pyridine nucleotide-disulfide oxidoreductase [Flaviaesturariibacter sp.]
MKPLLITLLFLATNAQAQSRCEKQKQRDSLLLRSFTNTFTDAVLHDDTTKLASLFSFPVTCSFCPHSETTDYATITRNRFLRTEAAFFLTPYLKEVLQADLYPIIRADESVKGSCTYSFGYPVVKPSNTWEGSQAFLTITKRKGKYMIESAWMVP